MNTLEHLRETNPGLPLFGVEDAAFAPYGRVLDLGSCEGLAKALAAEGIPEAGNCYKASTEGLERAPEREAIRRLVFGGMEIQMGYCNGRGFTLNAMEYHKCSELNFSNTGLVLLLALQSDLHGDRLDAADVKAFYLPPRVAVEIFPGTLHFAPCRVSEAGFDCLVVLEKGVNAALDRVDTGAKGEEKLLWMRGKWLLCHPDSPQAQKGAFVGITGENLTVKI